MDIGSNNDCLFLQEISYETGVSMSSVGRILHRHKFHPYGVTLNQELSEQDFEKRLDFCEMMETLIRDNDFARKVCFSDESTFHLSGYVNRHNMRYWCQENPHEQRIEHTQRPLKVMVWACTLGSRIIVPFFIEGNLTGEMYFDLLTKIISYRLWKMLQTNKISTSMRSTSNRMELRLIMLEFLETV